MAFSPFVWFTFLMLGVSQVSFASPKKVKNCETVMNVLCPCGKSGLFPFGVRRVVIPYKECVAVKMDDMNVMKGKKESCVPCNPEEFQHIDPCKKFANCEECDILNEQCLKCPNGKTGKFCEQSLDSLVTVNPADARNRVVGTLEISLLREKDGDLVYEDYEEEEDEFERGFPPVGIFIPPGGGNNKKDRFDRSITECRLPDYLDTAEIKCAIWPTYTKCNVSCIWGHTFPSGRSKNLKCRNKENNWKPEGFTECKPYVDCSVKLVSAGALHCLSNRISDPVECNIMCNEYDEIPEIPTRKYTCSLDGTFSPSLPFCAVKANAISTIRP